MKKITAMLMALTMAALTLTGCSNDEGSSSVAGQNVSGFPSESEVFTTTAPTEAVTEPTTEDNSLIMADTREELAKGLLEAILTEDKDTVIRYGFSSKIYSQMQEAITESKEKAELGVEDVIATSDFEIYFTGPSKSEVGSATDKVYVYIISPKLTFIELGSFTIQYDYDAEKYLFKKSSDAYSYAKSYNLDDESLTDYGYTNYYDKAVDGLKNAQLVS